MTTITAKTRKTDGRLLGVHSDGRQEEMPVPGIREMTDAEIEYSQPGLVAGDPTRVLDIEQIRTAKNGWAYVTTYIRPSESPKSSDAERWIYGSCEQPVENSDASAPPT